MIHIARTIYRQFYQQWRLQHLAAFLLVLSTVPLYILLALLMERVNSSGGPNLFNGLALVLIAFGILLLEIGVDVWLIDWTLIKPQRHVQQGIVSHFLRLSPRLYAQTSAGDVSTATIQYMHGTWFLRDTLRLCHALVSMGVLAFIIARTSWLLALVATVPVLFIGAVLHLIRRRWVTVYTKEREARSRLETFITDTLHGILTIKLFAVESLHIAQMKQQTEEHNQRWFKTRFLLNGITNLLASLSQFVIPLFILTGGYLIAQGELTAVQLVTLYIIFNILSHHTFNANYIIGYVLTDLSQLDHITQFLNKETEGTNEFPFKKGTIDFQNITFAYENKEPILNDFSLTIQSDQL